MYTSLIEQLQNEIGNMDKATLWQYLEQSRKMKSEAADIEKLCKTRCRELMGDAETLALDGDAGVYIQYSPRYEIPLFTAESLIQDQDLLSQVVKVDLKAAEELLPAPLWLELKTHRQLKGEPVKKLMVGKIKNV